ncbi:MAG: hypothetical protein A4S14_06795 [Proteobacteria bacterium SG_bin9]|nr:MAG: hypothetical protein A4S14_06795 [Proteobacteria bacterium SG_bin9]
MNEQQNFWAQEYADEYIRKNSDFDRALGTEAWRKMLTRADGVGSVLECGCNIGRNISFLEAALPGASRSIIEISKPAFDLVTGKHKLADAFNGPIERANFGRTFDLVFTIGVLIHIHPDDLIANMRKMYDLSQKYILIGEYFNRTPVMLEYQGQRDRLFKRDFGKTFLESFQVEVVDYGFLWGHVYDAAGFDDITWWLFRK